MCSLTHSLIIPLHLISSHLILLANIENMDCNWGHLPREVSVDCLHLLQSILSEKLDTRLGTASSPRGKVLQHPFFRCIDFSVLYEARSPYQDIADSFSLQQLQHQQHHHHLQGGGGGGLEGSSCYWLDERRAAVPAFDKEEPIRSQ